MPKHLKRFSSGHGLVNDLYQDGDRLVSVRHQPGRKKILEQAARERQTQPRKSDFMKPLARIDHEKLEQLSRKNPDVARGDRRAMERWLNTSEGAPYRTTPRGASRAFVFMGGKHGR